MFTEQNTVEDMICDALSQELGWRFVPRSDMKRDVDDVLVEAILSKKLMDLNEEIRQIPDRADEVIHRLNSIIYSAGEVGPSKGK